MSRPGYRSLPAAAFLRAFLHLANVQRTTICLGEGGGDDASAAWSMAVAASELRDHKFGFLSSVEDVVSLDNRPSEEETLLILCRDFQWGKRYPKWAFQNNVVWLVQQEEEDLHLASGVEGEIGWEEHLRLDSRFFTYSYSKKNGSIHLKERYRVKRGAIVTKDFGHWEPDTRSLNVTEPSLWERRTDLGGVELVDTVLEWKPFVILDAGGNFSLTSGAMVEFMWALQASLNFTVGRYSPPDGQWGFLKEVNETHKMMTGLVGELHQGKADLSTAGLYVLKERQEYADMLGVITDFSTIIIPSRLSASGSQINAMAYVNIFSQNTWIVLFTSCTSVSLFFLTFGLVFYGHLHSSPLALNERYCKGCRGNVAQQFLNEGIRVAFLTLLQRGVDISVAFLSTRIAFLTANLVAFIMFAYYNGDLTAKMTHKPPTVNLRSFQVLPSIKRLLWA